MFLSFTFTTITVLTYNPYFRKIIQMETALLIVTVLETALLGVIGVLKLVAPKTKTTVDDSVLARLESLEAFLEKLVIPAQPGAPVTAAK